MLLVAPKSPFLFKCLTKAVLSQLDVIEHCQCHDNMWSVGGLPVLPGICLFINLDSQRNFPYLEASDRDLILAELDWNVQFPTNTSQLLPSVAVLGTLGKSRSFLNCSRTQGSHSVCVSMVIPTIPHTPGGCLRSGWVSNIYRLLCYTSCWCVSVCNPAYSKMIFWNFS